ncbi:C-C motif chemokine 24 [Erinaceus europaeus]|uniref:C-C motif chemokine 24 n=1 Tax=Erinaceus europaeus TaxID=9365 RepID=A0ABM3VVC0_ERIEU|nr:C-C motif chemokine 24 [Erinaceus europaeus]
MASPTTFAVAALWLLVLCAHLVGLAGSAVIPSSCCVNFMSKKIPESRVVSYQLSSGSLCPKAGVIFTTRKGHKFCGNPKDQWVRKYMQNLDSKQKRGSARPKPQGPKASGHRRPTNIGQV